MSTKARILVVDDVKFISQMLAEILSKEGHEVETAGDGQAATRTGIWKEAWSLVTISTPSSIRTGVAGYR